MKETIINFSGRNNGNCENITKIIQMNTSQNETKIYNFKEINIFNCNNCDYECFIDKNKCPYIIDDCIEIYNEILNSDIVYYIIPNYCDYPCSNFFIFNERSLCYFNDEEELLEKYLKIKKKFIVISNTNEDNFEKIFSYHTLDVPSILFLSTNKYDQKGIDGQLMNNKNAKKAILDFI